MFKPWSYLRLLAALIVVYRYKQNRTEQNLLTSTVIRLLITNIYIQRYNARGKSCNYIYKSKYQNLEQRLPNQYSKNYYQQMHPISNNGHTLKMCYLEDEPQTNTFHCIKYIKNK